MRLASLPNLQVTISGLPKGRKSRLGSKISSTASAIIWVVSGRAEMPPLEEIEVGVTRNNPYLEEGDDDQRRWPEQALSAYELLQAYTSNVAYQNFCEDKVGTIVSGEVYQMWKREVLLMDDEGNELHLPKPEQIPADNYRKGETIRAIVKEVQNENNNPRIILSRTSPEFLKRLLEAEVPEINDGLIAIRRVARMPGERAKVAVESFDDRIDPVGACVGVKGSRVHGIVRELQNENIDVINFSNNMQLFIQRALSPAKVTSITLDEENHKAEVYLQPEEVSLAIGKGGINIKLASMLTEHTIDVFRVVSDAEADDEDIYLDEFSDEIDQWVIDSIKAIGLDTAKAVINAPREMLIEKADLEEETVDHLLEVLKAEFE